MKFKDVRGEVVKLARNGTFRLLAIVLIVLIAGPEAGIAIDLAVMLDIMGAELFLLSFVLGLRMLPRLVLHRVEKFVYQIDPYFFLPAKWQLRQCPALAAHAVPLFVPLCLAAALWGTIQAEG